MKKILLATAASTILAANTAIAGAEDIFYLKANVGTAYFEKQTDKSTNLQIDSENSFFFGVGLGYYVMDNLRFDLMFDHHMDPELNKTGKVQGITGDVVTKHKAEINTLMLNGYTDLFDISIATIYAGAGFGLARVEEKVTRTGGTPDESFSSTSKKNNNFAYALHLGASSEFAPGIHSELTYSWRGYGKTQSINRNRVDVGSTSYKGHHLLLGLRFDM